MIVKPSYLVGGTFNAVAPTMQDGDVGPLQFDTSGNLKVNVVIGGGGSGSNAAAGPTGSPVPSSADYQGVNIGGTLTGVTGLALGATTKAPTVAIVDGNGNQIISFGGGTQYATGTAVPTPTGTAALGWDGTDVRVLSTDSSGQLKVLIENTPAVTVSGTVGVTQSTSPWVVSLASTTITGNVSVVGTTTDGATTETNFLVVGGESNDVTAQYQPIPLGTGGRSVIIEGVAGGTAVPISGSISFTAPQHIIVDSGTIAVTQSTNPWIVAGAKTPADAYVNPTDAEDTFALLGGWDNTNSKWQRVQVDAGTGTVKVDIGSNGTANQGTANTLANAWPTEITDGVNGPVAVKAANVLPLMTDSALVVTLSPNNRDTRGLTELIQTLILEVRAMRTALVYMVTENGDVLDEDFDPGNQDFQPVN